MVHEIRRGETLLSIALRYGQEVRMLMEEPAKLPLRVGQKLKVLLQSLRGTLRWCETQHNFDDRSGPVPWTGQCPTMSELRGVELTSSIHRQIIALIRA